MIKTLLIALLVIGIIVLSVRILNMKDNEIEIEQLKHYHDLYRFPEQYGLNPKEVRAMVFNYIKSDMTVKPNEIHDPVLRQFVKNILTTS